MKNQSNEGIHREEMPTANITLYMKANIYSSNYLIIIPCYATFKQGLIQDFCLGGGEFFGQHVC